TPPPSPSRSTRRTSVAPRRAIPHWVFTSWTATRSAFVILGKDRPSARRSSRPPRSRGWYSRCGSERRSNGESRSPRLTEPGPTSHPGRSAGGREIRQTFNGARLLRSGAPFVVPGIRTAVPFLHAIMPRRHCCASNVVLGETDEREETGGSKK